MITIADVPTQSGSRYLQQLCKHWSHKYETSFTPQSGTIGLSYGLLTMTAHSEHLEVRIDLLDDATAEEAQGVVARHLDRFAFREAPLAFAWRTADA